MASFGDHFKVDASLGKSQDKAIIKGDFYRITILSERLVRLEYSKDGKINDSVTDFALNRRSPVPEFKMEEDEKYLVISTTYFSLQYEKEKPFKGPSFAPDANLKVKLLNTDKLWYFGHPEARNFRASAYGLIISDSGIVSDAAENQMDIYLFMYKRDFGMCLKDYYTLTGYPLMIPRYALGIWWYRDKIYSYDDTKKLLEAFNYHGIPLSVLLLGEFWHIKDPFNVSLHKTGFSFNKELFPEPSEFIKTMHENKVRVGLQIDPTEGVRPEEDSYIELVRELDFQRKGNIPFNALDKMFMINYFNFITSFNLKYFLIIFFGYS